MIKFFHKILLFLFEKFTLCAAKLVKIEDFKSILLAQPSTPFNAYGFPDSVHTIKKKVRMLWFYVPIKRAIPFKNKKGATSMQGKQKKGLLKSARIFVSLKKGSIFVSLKKGSIFVSLARILTSLFLTFL